MLVTHGDRAHRWKTLKTNVGQEGLLPRGVRVSMISLTGWTPSKNSIVPRSVRSVRPAGSTIAHPDETRRGPGGVHANCRRLEAPMNSNRQCRLCCRRHVSNLLGQAVRRSGPLSRQRTGRSRRWTRKSSVRFPRRRAVPVAERRPVHSAAVCVQLRQGACAGFARDVGLHLSPTSDVRPLPPHRD